MPNQPRPPEAAERDGTSQSGRGLDALRPDYVSVDERTLADLLAFAAAYGKELKYIGPDGNPAGDWSGFIGPDLRAEDVAAFLSAPERFSAQTSPALFRPHRVLFLSFLQLLWKAREEINKLTARHLDFYYQTVLRMGRKPSIPDRVNVIAELLPDEKAALLPAGSLLDAGADSAGRDRIYKTDRDLVVNRGRIARMSSLFIDRRRMGLRQAVLSNRNNPPGACEALFLIALAAEEEPRLPPYPDGSAVNHAKLMKLRDGLRRAESQFFLSLPELRDLWARRQRRQSSPDEWDEINGKIEIAGRKKRGGAAFQIDHTSREFDKNLTTAIGVVSFGTLPEVSRLEDVYDLRGRGDVQAFIRDKLYFDNLEDFARMMQLLRRFDTEWSEINRILESAGRKKRDPSYRLGTADIAAFATNLQAAIGVTEAQLKGFLDEVAALEAYFYMPAEQFAIALDEIRDVPQQDWAQVFPILEQAHREQLRQARRAEIRRLHQSTSARLVDLIRYVLGEPPDSATDPGAMERLLPYLGPGDGERLLKLDQAKDWSGIYSLLEVAQRNRLGEPAPLRSRWLNLHPAEDATRVRSRRGLLQEERGVAQGWPPFGAAAPSTSAPPRPVLGWALCSPLLVLREGTRTLTLTLGFRAGKAPLPALFNQDGELPLLFEISTDKGFVPCSVGAPIFGAYTQLVGTTSNLDPQAVQFVLTLKSSVGAIAAPPAQDEEGEPGASLAPDGSEGDDSGESDSSDGKSASSATPAWPVLRLMLRPIWSADEGKYVARYPEFGSLELLAAHLKVEALGLKAILAENDESQVDPQKPFEPFGSEPAAGSRLLIAHPEVSGKRIDSLTFSFQWMGAPQNLAAHYANYGLPTGSRFSARISLVDRYGGATLVEEAPLFGDNGQAPVTIRTGRITGLGRDSVPELLAAEPDSLDESPSAWERYLQWELNAPDFQHTSYPTIAASRALALAVDSARGAATLDPTKYQVNPPYTPKLKGLTLGYSSSVEIRFDEVSPEKGAGERTHRAFHIHPFGRCDVEAERTGIGVPFLPRYLDDGELYLGLRGVSAPETLSLFFQMAEGSADPDQHPQPARWSYLSGDRWLPLDRNLLLDTTRSLSNSGIVELKLDPVLPSERMPGGFYWLRAALPSDTGGVCEIVGIHTQAISATFVDRGNAPDHFREPLPAGTITQLLDPIPAIAGVHQPYTSYGGRMAEAGDVWATRVSERLRHKQRALSAWDYERLLLERFPELHKVKCIPARPGDPGKVDLIVIPDIRNKLPFEPFEPKAPADLLAEVREFIVGKAPAAARIEVKNPQYVTVRVRLGVRFRGTGNEEFYKQKLNDDLNRYLAPWAYDEGADIAIGGRIYASTLIDFVDRRPYVDYVAGIKLFTNEGGEERPIPRPASGDLDGYYVETSRPDAVLVAARTHQIDVLGDALYEEKRVMGIGLWKLELDFVIERES